MKTIEELNLNYKKIYTELAKNQNIDEKVLVQLLNHVSTVKRYSMKILKTFQCNDKNLVEKVKFIAFFHDIGRLYSYPFGQYSLILHGIISKRIMSNYINDEELLNGLASHVGVGLKKEEILSSITEKEKEEFKEEIHDYFPNSLAQKLVCFADKMVFSKKVMYPEEAFIDIYSKIPEKIDLFYELQKSVFIELWKLYRENKKQ
ncbi:MAG: hypothetical protein QXS41_02740 [Candidatus Woesearchaeota archaeon]